VYEEAQPIGAPSDEYGPVLNYDGYGAYESDPDKTKGLKILAWFAGGFGLLFWLAHQADQHPNRRKARG
jgi:hypothetical protein